ncbi:glycosyltransferase [soil metagenome]|jgi:glycosyltransferase involved in cell wall biosynthesis
MKSIKNQRKISVIIPTYNRSELLSYTLDSLVAQNIDKKYFEVIVADDGSTDDTRAVAKTYESKLNLKYVFQEDMGYRPASARNLGIMYAESEICLFIDSGVILDENCVNSHIRFHERCVDDSVAIGYIYGFEENNHYASLLKQIINVSNATKSITDIALNPIFCDVRETHYIKYYDRLEDLPAAWIYFWTANVSSLKRNLLAVELFDTNYDGKWGVEDNDLGFRLHRAGVKICLLRSAKSIHYPHPKDKEQRHKEGFENCIYFYKKFQTPDIKIFLDNFLKDELIDVNEIYMEIEANTILETLKNDTMDKEMKVQNQNTRELVPDGSLKISM